MRGEKFYTEESGDFRFDWYVSQDDMPVRGNALASGDEATDKAAEDEIIDRLDSGDVWAWATIGCRCVHVPSGIDGWDHLGGCSYRDSEDFFRDGYAYDMLTEAQADCESELDRIRKVLCKA